ncbi:hypothetical protein ACOTV5_02445 [Aliarcobacter butzleri]|uniref:hypothetical protein n=1 Tax=Aliarcobacter butzleri TaxID=28197 RepID=UPI003AFA35B6
MEVKLDGLDKVLAVLHPDIYKKSLSRTINDIGDKARTQMVKSVGQQYNMKASELKKFIQFRKSRYSNLEYVIDVRSKRFNAMRFAPKKLKQKGKMSVLIKKDGGRKVFKSAVFTAKNGALLKRKGNTQEIVPVQTVSIPQMFNKKILKETDDMVVNEFASKFQSNFNFYIGNVKK